MSEEKGNKDETVKVLTKKTPVKVVLPKKCDHIDKLEAVSADVAELPRVVERRHNIFRCTNCGAIIVKDKK